MKLVPYSPHQKGTYYQPQSSPTNDLVTCTETAIEAYAQGLLNLRYFSNGMKHTVKSEKDLPRLMHLGFALQLVDGKFYLTRGLPGGALPVEKELDNKLPGQKSIFISYCSNQQEIARKIHLEFEQAGYLVVRDEKYLKAGDSIQEFMDLITHRNLDYVLVILSDDYLKDRNCMYAIQQMTKRHKFQDSVLTYIADDKMQIDNTNEHYRNRVTADEVHANGHKIFLEKIATLGPSEPPSAIELKLINKPPDQKSVFISYCDEQVTIAQEIEDVFKQAGFLVVKDFLDVITHRNLDYALVVLSDNYLKRSECMDAVHRIMDRYKFQDTLVTYVLTDDAATKADIYAGSKKWENHWHGNPNIVADCRKFIDTARTTLHLREDVLKKGNGLKTLLDTITTLESKKPKTLSIEEKIQHLREEALNNKDVQNDLASYIPVLGSRCLFDPKEQTFDLDHAVNQFLSSDRQVFLLIGESGGGKSTYLRSLENRLWQQWTPDKPIPLFISLPALKQPFKEAVAETLKTRGFTDAEIKELKTKHSFLFLLDGYDELKQKQNLYIENQLDQWKGQTIITCRTQYLRDEQSSYQNYFTPPSRGAYDEASISPFTPQQIEAYCRKYIQLNNVSRTWEQYKADIASVPDLADIIETPFLLRIIVEVLPDMIEAHRQSSNPQEQLKLLPIDIFDAFVANWFDREEQRIIKIGAEVEIPNLQKHFATFATRLALAMTQDNIVSVDYAYDPANQSKWDIYFGPDPQMTLIRSGVPLRKIGKNSYAFIHKSLLEYFSTRAIVPSTHSAPQVKSLTSTSTPVDHLTFQGTASLSKLVEADLDNKLPGQKSIFISYSWDQQAMARDIDAEFERAGYLVIRDEKYLQTNDDLREFMNVITHRQLDHVLVLLSDDYLKRPNCMYEVNRIMKRHRFPETLVTHVLADDIYHGSQKYEDHWRAKLSAATTNDDKKQLAATIDDCKKFIHQVCSRPHVKKGDLPNGLKTFVDAIKAQNACEAISSAETQLLNKPSGQKSIFISYFDQQSAIAHEIDRVFEQAGYLVVRDQQNECITHPNLDYVLVILSDGYLKDGKCMNAVNQIMKRYKFQDTLLTYVLTDDHTTKAAIDTGGKSYEAYWQKTNEETVDDCREFIKMVGGQLNLREDDLKKGNGYKTFLDTINDLEKRKVFSVEKKIQQLKEEALNNKDVQNDLASYIPVLGSRCLFDPKEQTFDLDQAVDQFLAGDRKVFLLLGDSGGGKSTYLRYLENRLWQQWDPSKPIPLFISLPTLKQPFKEAITETLREKGFSEAEQKELQKKYSFLFLLDGYDELKQKNNLYIANQLDQWKGKTIISCRTQYLSGEQTGYQNYFAPPSQSLFERAASLDEASISPFTPQQIEAYCRKYIQLNHLQRTWEQYQADIASVPELAEIIETPFLLRIVAEVLPDMIAAHRQSNSKEQLKLLRIEIFDAFIKNWFDKEEKRIIQTAKVQIPDLKTHFDAFATRLALEMTQDNIVSVDYEYDPFNQNKWDSYFGPDPKTTVVRSGVPLRKIGPHSYAFVHKSLLEYFSARAIVGPDTLPLTHAASSSSSSSQMKSAPISFDNLNKKILIQRT